MFAVLSDVGRRGDWWPGVERVEDAREDRWTEVFLSRRGKPVRLDFHLLASEPPWRMLWEQDLVGTPFERVLVESLTEVILAQDGEGTLVTLAQQQKLRGYSRTGSLLLRRGQTQKLERVLAALAQAAGAGDGFSAEG